MDRPTPTACRREGHRHRPSDPEETGKSGSTTSCSKRSTSNRVRSGSVCGAGSTNLPDGRHRRPRRPFPDRRPVRRLRDLLPCALHGAQLFREAGVPAQAFLASEYATGTPPIGDALVVGVTQSGETADTLSALRAARRRGARTLAVTNVVGSTAARECDHALYIRAGPEIGVAATRPSPPS